jgi:hypothetical protein
MFDDGNFISPLTSILRQRSTELTPKSGGYFLLEEKDKGKKVFLLRACNSQYNRPQTPKGHSRQAKVLKG